MRDFEIHIAMVIREKITDISYCGRIHVKYFVTENFYLPSSLMCNTCIDEWENEDIRMQTPQKIEKLMDANKKD